jgi:hypothetical protein
MSRRLHRQKTPPLEPPSPTIIRPDHLPSDKWPTSHPDYSPEIHQLACSINYLALRNKCSHLRNGSRCIISPKYYVGANNLVREIVFQDGIVWIALFARLDSVGAFAGQVRLMQKLRSKIPVPEVYAYSDELLELGGRYLLMEGICGLKAEAEYFIFGVPDHQWNHVLDQLGGIMADGMEVSWKNFHVNGKEFHLDSAFWIDPAIKNIRFALHELARHRKLLEERQYSTFSKSVQSIIRLLFAELLYLCSELLRQSQRPSDAHDQFPSNLPSLTMENVVFDSDYNVKGLIGFSRTESVSSWQYFQYPFCLEDSFDDPSMMRTVKWMKESFIEAWKRKLESLGMKWEGMEPREPWCQKEKAKILLEFRTSKARSLLLLEQLLAQLYHFDNTVTVDLLLYAHLYTVCSALGHHSTAWDPNRSDLHVELFARLITMNTARLHELAGAGQALTKGKYDSQILQLPTFAQSVP